jgi:polysaccharide export outer membrane protein
VTRLHTAILTAVLALPLCAAAQTPIPLNAPQTPGSPTATSTTAGATTIGPGDLVEFSVFGVPDLSSKGRVTDDGMLRIPLAGPVKVGGMNLAEAQKAMEDRLMEGGYLRAPQVSLFVLESVTQTVNVLGEVSRPGTFPLLGAKTLYDAIAAAGGLTPKAGNNITVRHRDRPDAPVSVPLHPGTSNTELADTLSLPISGGDTITVGQAGIVYVVGAVTRPSGFVLEGGGNTTVLKALALAGGATSTASLGHSRILRRGPDGKTIEQLIPLKNILAAKADDVELQPNDVLFVPDSAAKAAAKHATDVAIQTAATVGLIFIR